MSKKNKYIEENSEYIKKYFRNFDLLIITATQIEKQTLHKYLKPLNNKDSILKISKNKYTYYIGKFGKYNAVHVSCGSMGSINRDASITTTIDGISNWKPKIVLMVGIAFGIDKRRQKIGDVLISSDIISYETQKISKGRKSSNRWTEMQTNSSLLNIFKNIDVWNYKIPKIPYISTKIINRNPKKIIGSIFSGEKLINDINFRNELLKSRENAVGGDMEGVGVYTACDNRVNYCILVKGICDFADGNKDRNKIIYQKIACDSAVNLCYTVFNSAHSFTEMGLIPNQIIKTKKQKNTTRKLNSKRIISLLKEQLVNQLKKQENSGKYLPNTFVEIGDSKDLLRYLCDPILYSKKFLDEIKVIDFKLINSYQKEKKLKELSIEYTKFKRVSGININKSASIFDNWKGHLDRKLEEISGISYKIESKIKDKLNELNYLNSYIALITETAGQGKTNFLCDFISNFIINREIPALFLTGSEINATNIKQSILNILLPDTDEFSFAEVISTLKPYCEKHNKYFVIFVDGLNENLDYKIFNKNLENFIEYLLKFKFIKVVLSCRTEYYNLNFNNLDKASFSKEMQKIEQLISRNINDDLKYNVHYKLFYTYIKYFKINYSSITNMVYNQLTSNFLLLRIFCEAYSGQNIESINNIYKEELFDKYYKLKCDEINNKLSKSDEFNISNNFKIQQFVKKLIIFMINNKQYSNVPLDELLDDNDSKEVYIRFLDENIFIKRDLQAQDKKIFTSTEVVNFTYDGFRDFLICKYLYEALFKTSKSDFISFIENEVQPNKPLMEGCASFLFFMERKQKNDEFSKIIQNQQWYNTVFTKNIFDLRDTLITENDKTLLKEAWLQNEHNSKNIIYNLIFYRYETKYFNNLSIDFLFSTLREFSQEMYYKHFTKIFSDKYSYSYDRINQENLIEDLYTILNENELDDDSPYHKFFELLIYMFLNYSNWKIIDLYERYSFKYKHKSLEQLNLAIQNNNPHLKNEIENFVITYEQ